MVTLSYILCNYEAKRPLTPFCIKDVLGHAKSVGCYFHSPGHNEKLDTKGQKPQISESFHLLEISVCGQQFLSYFNGQEGQLFASETHGQIITIIGVPATPGAGADVTKASNEVGGGIYWESLLIIIWTCSRVGGLICK